MGINNKKHDFENHLKTVVREGLCGSTELLIELTSTVPGEYLLGPLSTHIDPSDLLVELADKTAI
jgi:hypothetical protein